MTEPAEFWETVRARYAAAAARSAAGEHDERSLLLRRHGAGEHHRSARPGRVRRRTL